MNKTILAYLAGVMDSDGYFTIKRATYNIRVLKDSKNPHYQEQAGLKQVQPEAIKLILRNFGGSFFKSKPYAKNGKNLFCVLLSCRKANFFVKKIYPYLRIKKKQASLLLALRRSLDKGRTKVSLVKTIRYGKEFLVKRYSIAEKEILIREKLRDSIKQLNDSRNDIKHQPKPWK